MDESQVERRLEMASELTEWRPFSDFAELRHRLDQAFRDIADGAQDGWTPSVDVVRKEGELVLRADLPGIKSEDVKIEVEDDVLTVSGEHREEREEKEEHYVRRERRYGSFSRSMVLPKGVKGDDIEAKCEDGVLEVTVPVPASSEGKQTIDVKSKSE
jgi:HSP20 family protein